MNNPLVDLSEAFDAVGHPMYSDEDCVHALAYLHVDGGNEQVVLNKAFNSLLIIAQRRFKIQGGEIPTKRFFDLFPQACKEIKLGEDCPWLIEMLERYNLFIGDLSTRKPMPTSGSLFKK